MKIPIHNLYFLLCYAWDKLEEADTVDVSREDLKTYIDLFAKILIGGTTRLLKRGLDRGYIEYEEDTRSPRGKFDLEDTIKRHLLLQARIHCRFDQLDHDVLHNRILRTTLGNLTRCEDLNGELRQQIVRLYRRLHGVTEIPLNTQTFRRVVLHRNNHYYRFLLHVCELIHDHLLIDEETGTSRFQDFLRDERAMARLFEAFVRNFYRREQEEFRVGSELIPWQRVEASEEDLRYLPVMRTDVSLNSKERQIVLDTKYYAEALQSYRSSDTVRSGHLYQLFAYLQNCAARASDDRTTALAAVPVDAAVEGILLYPCVGRTLDLRYSLHGHPIRVATVDLDQDWRGIHDRLLDLLRPAPSPEPSSHVLH
jgi:5-methylcytosine-specific restriction enzyme subunit McrC